MNSTVYIALAVIIVAIVASACSRRKQPEPESGVDLHNRLYKEGCDLIDPYMRLQDTRSKDATHRRAQRDLNTGISKLKQVVEMNPDNWAAYWIMGKAYQALDQRDEACDSFGMAYAIHKENADVAREYMFECLNLGRSEEGVSLAEAALTLEPNEPGLLANLALALLIDAQPDRALSVAEQSLAIEPSDQITQDLKQIILEVKTGKRPQPHKYGDIQGVE